MPFSVRRRKPSGRPSRRLRLLPAPLVVLAGALVALPTATAAAGTADTDPMAAARALAVASGHAVPVDSATTEISTVQADPDGTFTATTSLLPVRVRRDGTWVPVDATLTAAADGTLSPRATPNAVRLSGGGSGPLATLTHEDGTSMAFTLPFPLPAPTVTGDTALYTSVLPGVDLSVSVTDQGGFSDVLIVRDAAAAADPRLAQLTLAADTHGLSLEQAAGGGMEARTADGTVAYVSPRPLMWDSGTAPVPLTEFAPASRAAQAADGASTDAALSGVTGPGSDARVAEVPMSTTAHGLTLAPQRSVLTDPTLHYPLYIDPYTNPVSGTAGHYDEVYSNSSCSDAPQYDKPQTNGEGVGYQNYGGKCGNGIERSYYTISTGNLHEGFQIYDSRVTIATTYAASWDCSHDQPITLHTVNAISSGTDWNSRPGTHDTAFPPVSTTVPSGANANSSCSNHTATFVVTDQAQTLADHDGDGYNAAGDIEGAPNTWTIGLYGNESSSSSNDDYLRVSESLTLTTKFDIAPATPGNAHITPAATGASGACVMTGDGWIGATTYSGAGSNIQLHSTVTSQISGEDVAAHYHVWDRSVLDAGGDALDKSTPASSYLASGTDAVEPIGFSLLDGHEYGWDVYAQDDSTLHLKSPISDHCWFKADLTAPATPVVATNPSFPPVGSGAADPVVYAAAGGTTTFTVTGADNPATDTSCAPGACLSSGIDHFIWKLDALPTPASSTSAALTGTAPDGTGTATLTVPVTNWGVHTLYVAGVDAAGNPSTAPAGYTYTVPWNPSTAINPGDVTGDRIPDLLATTQSGNLDLVPGDQDPAQTPAAAQSGAVSGSAPPVTGPVVVSPAADSPDGTGWNNYLVTHRGNLHGADVDDLFAYNKNTRQFYIVKNDLDPVSDTSFPLTSWSALGGYLGKRFDVVVKDPCATADLVSDASRCRSTDYDATGWHISQMVAPGNVFGNTSGYPAVVTVENGKLWIYQSDGGLHLKNPLLLGDGDWSGQTLIGPGTVQGTPVLWARDDNSGTVYSYPLTVDQTTGLPPLLHAPTRTPLVSGVTTTTGGKLCLASPSAKTADGTVVVVAACDSGAGQQFTLRSDGTVRVLGKCLSTQNAAVAQSTPVVIDTCDGSAIQQWTPAAAGGLTHTSSGKCLADPAANRTPNTQQIIYTCGSSGQNWNGGGSTPLPTGTAQTDIGPLLPANADPVIASPGDINSPAGAADGNPDLYTVDTTGALVEYVGSAPSGTTAHFAAAPVGLGQVTDTASHWWKIDEGTGTSLADCGGDPACTSGLKATLGGSYSWAADSSRGQVLSLSGTTGYAVTGSPAVDTSGSYSVSAWVKLNSTAANSDFVSEAAGDNFGTGFQLYYSSGKKAWAFGRHTSDVNGAPYQGVYGSNAVIGRWTHLVGVYDAGTNQLSIYIDGRLAGTRAYTGTEWAATGPLQIGRGVSGGSYVEYANGQVSNVRVYPVALPPAAASAPGDIPVAIQLG
ncbi:ricin-type beta-trefoil lectin domain protein [Streptomyces cocklensis]|nr:LamG-like jellyroll fold domain-containing protein [Actinacidiphila cocklensis]MDD1062602.1 ricin-type beta-trefoil lectin domain protein [Actinacidiphila cocklensis]WSX75512.1 ricin-type beta-trefoil lectin domain protein [Streptomyces sp. NBC_00899]